MQHLAGAGLQVDAISFHDGVGERFAVETENYDLCHNTGGMSIGRLEVAGCSSGFVLEGLDWSGEWTQYYAPVAEAGTYQVFIKCRGLLDVNYGLRLVFFDVTPTQDTTWGAIKSLYE